MACPAGRLESVMVDPLIVLAELAGVGIVIPAVLAAGSRIAARANQRRGDVLKRRKEAVMWTDLVYVLLTVGFFLGCMVLAKALERLS